MQTRLQEAAPSLSALPSPGPQGSVLPIRPCHIIWGLWRTWKESNSGPHLQVAG